MSVVNKAALTIDGRIGTSTVYCQTLTALILDNSQRMHIYSFLCTCIQGLNNN